MRCAILLAVVVIVPWAGLGSCGSGSSAAQPDGRPGDAVERFYRAIAAGECSAAMAELTRSYRDTLTGAAVSCDELIEQINTYPLQSILETTTDGRQGGARLVRVRLRGRTSDVIVRVEVEAGQWKIASL